MIGTTALNGDYWKPMEEKRRRTAPPVFTIDDPFYSKIEKNIIQTAIVESKQEISPKKPKEKTPKKDVDSKKASKPSPNKKEKVKIISR
jgi:hypothetical protein